MFPITWSQVDWNGGFVRLEPGTTKNQEGRAFPITPALRAILERRQELTRRCERAQARIIPLFFHRSGRPIHSFRRSWKKACEKADLLFHDLRRSAVRNLERASVPRSMAMKLTGHKTESIYRRYAIVAGRPQGSRREASSARRRRAGQSSYDLELHSKLLLQKVTNIARTRAFSWGSNAFGDNLDGISVTVRNDRHRNG